MKSYEAEAHTKALLSESEQKIQELELKLAENVQTFEADKKTILSKSDERIRELEVEIEERKHSEARILDFVITQTNQLEQTKVLLEEAKFEITSLHKKLEKWEDESGQDTQDFSTSGHQDLSMKEELESLKSELKLTKESLVDVQKKEQLASSKAERLLEEIGVLKHELKLTTDAEENEKKAMDDLAFALKEVALEANQLKDKLCMTQAELEHSRSQEEHLNAMLKGSEESYKSLFDEVQKEAERYKNTAARLKIEHEESVLAWSGKETGFVDCIRRAEEDRYAAQQENVRLQELLLEKDDNKGMFSKEENSKLRDILKQALNEAKVAREATAIAQDEISQLKDALAEKEEALNFVNRENENYRVNEIAALKNIKELKRLLIESSKEEEEAKYKTSSKEWKEIKEKKPALSGDAKKEDKEKTSSKEAATFQNGGIFGKVFSFNLKEHKISNTHEEAATTVDDEIEVDKALKGSIFEVDSPGSTIHHRRNSSTFTKSADFDNAGGTQGENSRKKKAMLRRFGDLVKRSTTYSTKKEPS